MLSEIITSYSVPIDAPFKKKQSAHAIVEFINTHIPNFPKYFQSLRRLPENKLNMELYIFLDREARNADPDPAFMFVHEYIIAGSPRQVDIGVINSKRYSDSKTLFTIECKILPTPGRSREKEYVQNEVKKKSGKIWEAGAMARYKKKLYASHLSSSGIIAYVKERDFDQWFNTINKWIIDLSKFPNSIWAASDCLSSLNIAGTRSNCISTNSRVNSEDINLFHIWIKIIS